jgi:hypothetical protein
MMLSKKSIPRRSFLRSAGATIALPVLDAMFPAMAAASQLPQAARRFSIVYVPNGINMQHWTPQTAGSAFELPNTLAPLAPYKDKMLILSGMNNSAGDALPGEGESAPHERAGGVFLTGVHPLREGHVGASIDQIIAREMGRETELSSLELGLHNTDIVGSCEKGWSCAYRMTLSWRTPTTPLPIEYRPRAVFERLFGDSSSTDPAVRLERIHNERSILDSVMQSAAQLQRRVGAHDRIRLSEYLDGMRDVERRIQMAERESGRKIPNVERPVAVPAEFSDHLKLMFDLQVLAFQTDMTRMITFMVGPEQSNRTYREIGIPDVHHSISHHRGDPVNLEKIAKIDHYHTELFTYYLDKLAATPDIDGSLLDNMIIMYGSAMSDGNEHLLQNLPVLLLGGGTGQLQGGKHIRYPNDTPISNLYLTVMDKLGLRADRFGDSTGKADLLSV